ncbi:MAG: hypothetical protein UX75_C0036G0039 [Candidatus Moranbacteria bacterium GW2011_GWE2_47_10]|nr:MAG: hypothetical protein UX75_C0036G0039 [Candidatus Moranbacteria bacterium GW2011_GWE2_47_10]
MAGKPKSGKTNAGAKSKYEDSWPEIAEGYARRGLSDADIAKNLGISVNTFYVYQNKYEEFSKAIQRGKKPANLIVENALYKRCLGFVSEEVKERVFDDDQGKPRTEITTTRKEIIPDINAIRFWLTNREPELWKNFREEIASGDNADEKIKEQLESYFKALLNKQKDAE